MSLYPEIDLSNETPSMQNFYYIAIKIPIDLSDKKERKAPYMMAKYCVENGGLLEGETIGQYFVRLTNKVAYEISQDSERATGNPEKDWYKAQRQVSLDVDAFHHKGFGLGTFDKDADLWHVMMKTFAKLNGLSGKTFDDACLNVLENHGVPERQKLSFFRRYLREAAYHSHSGSEDKDWINALNQLSDEIVTEYRKIEK